MNRRRKAQILSQALTGDTAALRQLRLPALPAHRELTRADYEAMSDAELKALIEYSTGQPCPDFDSMSDEELDAIIARAEQ